LRRGRQNEEEKRVRKIFPNLPRALDLHIEHRVPTTGKNPFDLTLERSVELAAIGGPLQELSLVPPADKLVAREEVVVRAVPLIWALGPGGGRDRVAEILPSLQQHLGNRGFPAARRSREHQEKRLHSRFSSCSRNFSNSPFIATTC